MIGCICDYSQEMWTILDVIISIIIYVFDLNQQNKKHFEFASNKSECWVKEPK